MRARAKPRCWSDAGSPNFRCIPFARDVLFDPGRMAVPRISALLMLRSTLSTVSAPATCPFRGSITNPTQLLCTLRGRRYRRLTQHSLPVGPLRPYPVAHVERIFGNVDTQYPVDHRSILLYCIFSKSSASNNLVR